jgi:hypothetical protein
MFVVAIVSEFYDDDAGRDRKVIGDHLFETTAGAEAYIASITFEAKKKVYLEQREDAIRASYGKIFTECHPEPPYSTVFVTKPKFDHDRANDKAYQADHAARVAAWRKEVMNPVEEVYHDWVAQKREYVAVNAQPDIDDLHRFAKTSLKSEIDQVVLRSYEEITYSTKVLEVFK